MAHTLSANKRMRQGAKRRDRNRGRKKVVRTEIKKMLAIVEKADVAGAETELKAAMRTIDRTVAKGTMHKNTAARRKSRLARKLNALKAAPAKA